MPINQSNIPLVDKVNLAHGAAGTPKFLDPNALQAEMSKYDTDYYNRSAQDFLTQHPELVAGRNALIRGAVAPILGQRDPYAQRTLAQAGLGGVNLGNTVEDIATNLGQPIASAENRDRGYFANLLNGPLNSQLNLEKHQIGLSSGDVANIALTNAHQARINQTNRIQNQMNAALAGVQQQAQTQGAIASGIGSIANAAINRVTNPTSSYASPFGYGSGLANLFSPSGGGFDINNPADTSAVFGSAGSDLGSTVPISGGGGSNW